MTEEATGAADRETVTAKTSRRMAASPERVIDAWLDLDQVRRWSELSLASMGLAADVRRVEIDAQPGGRFTFSDMRDGEEAVHRGTYRVIDRSRRLVFTWFTSEEEEREDLSTVTLTVEPQGAGSVATMSHEMSVQWAEYVQQTADAWGRMLAQVDALLSEPPGVVAEPGALRLERLLPGPVERVWSYLVESEKRRDWLAAGDIEPRVGGRVEHLFRHQEISGEATPERYEGHDSGPAVFGEVTVWDPPRRLAYVWPGQVRFSEVSFELHPEGEDVRLVLTHRRLASRSSMVSVASGWHAHLGILIDRLSGRAPRGFWSAHAAAEQGYQASLRSQVPEHAIVLSRVVEAPVKSVFQVWVDPAAMRRWWGSKVEADVRVGGSYRIENPAEEGGTYMHQGKYLVIEEDRRLVQTFGAGVADQGGGDPDAHSPYRDEFVEARFTELDPSHTELTFINGWDGEAMDQASREATREAWSAWLDLMEAAALQLRKERHP